MEEVRLYDLDRDNYPRVLGQPIRSIQVHLCSVCGAKTNEVVFAGGFVPGLYTRILCPHCGEDWHIQIGKAVQEANPDHDKIKRMKAEIAHLATDDIVGTPDFSKLHTLGIPGLKELFRC